MTRAEFEEACLVTCPHCRRGEAVRQRDDTGEFVHDGHVGSAVIHTICWANGLRNSRFVKELVDG